MGSFRLIGISLSPSFLSLHALHVQSNREMKFMHFKTSTSTSLIVGCYSYGKTCRLVETLNFEHFHVFGHFTMGINCNTKHWIRFLSETVVCIAIGHVYQLDYCGFNEPLFENFGGFVVEKMVCRVPMSIIHGKIASFSMTIIMLCQYPTREHFLQCIASW